jgi:hypothetical protein
VLGILSFVLGPCAGLPAIGLSWFAFKRPGGHGKANAGMFLAVVGSIFVPALVYNVVWPRFSKLRQAAERIDDAERLHAVGTALRKSHDDHDHYPSATDDLSWRVHLLPYLGKDDLHRQFRLTEPWDSAANLPVSRKVVPEYISTHDPAATTDTRLRVFVGGGALFDPPFKGKPVPIGSRLVTDGTSFTIFAVEAAEPVPWPQPKELTYDPNGPLPEFGHPKRPDVFFALMADGSVRALRKDISEKTMRKLITRGGGEVIDPSEW